MSLRIGQGFDVHAFAPNRPLIVGGVQIPHAVGLLGHSDADVLLHAICDALLGALALGDIGHHFPDSDPRYQGANSIELLIEVVKKVTQAGYRILNIDTTIIAQSPKMAPFIAQMQMNIANACQVKPTQISVKATTTEHLGFTGRNEGIAAQAIALLEVATH
jgi:2-C-methyl-D-erythritol 2,4-cyclodiphosphate synthase